MKPWQVNINSGQSISSTDKIWKRKSFFFLFCVIFVPKHWFQGVRIFSTFQFEQALLSNPSTHPPKFEHCSNLENHTEKWILPIFNKINVPSYSISFSIFSFSTTVFVLISTQPYFYSISRGSQLSHSHWGLKVGHVLRKI